MKQIYIQLLKETRRYNSENESYGEHGFSQQEFAGEELVDVEEDEFDEPDDIDFDDMLDEE